MLWQRTESAPDWPDAVPVLSKGKHRNPHKGACFMEFASFLAGERWSDHPACTHRLLAALARLVNDYSTDAGRARLASLIPSVIGLTSDDIRVDAVVALRSATVALPIAAAERQNVLAVSAITARGVLTDRGAEPVPGLMADSASALADVPHAVAWAERFIRGMKASRRGFGRHAAPSAVRLAAQGIARSCVRSPDDYLYAALAGAIEDSRAIITAQNDHVKHADTYFARSVDLAK